MHILKPAPVLTIAALVIACGDKPNPVAPSPPAGPMVASLDISGADYVLTGSTTAYTATATLSDGSANRDACVVQQRRNRSDCRQCWAP